MNNSRQVRGMLLEEAVLYLLQCSGYRTVYQIGNDPTLCLTGAGLAVKGRGAEHQIDAIADYLVYQPFSNPQRLLVEAKCYDSFSPVGITVIRNAVGVLKDVSEFWVSRGNNIARGRYHYQYAIFSASEFTKVSQSYAYAQDVHLFPLLRSQYFMPILQAINNFPPIMNVHRSSKVTSPWEVSKLRSFIRSSLYPYYVPSDARVWESYQDIVVEPFITACQQLHYSLIAFLGGRFPIFLAPSQEFLRRQFEARITVRIYWDNAGWYLRSTNGTNLFSFDLPGELFKLYAENGSLTPNRALDLKEEMMSTFQVVQTVDGSVRVISFVLDHDWLAEIRRVMN